MLEQDGNKSGSHDYAAHMISTITALIAVNDIPKWIIDTGATNHMISVIELLDKKSIT